MNKKISKTDIKSFTFNQFTIWLKKNSIETFRAKQIFRWIYQQQCNNFKKMNNLSKKLRNILNHNFFIGQLKTKQILTSTDGSKKYIFNLIDNCFIEAILIPERNHLTLCISSQVGCAQKCKFCLTGKNGFTRNLKFEEIISQIIDVKKNIKNKFHIPISNLVFMGMGEPLTNYKEVIKAIKIITNQEYGLNISPKRITVSTVGIIPNIKLLKKLKINLAISLNAIDNRIRNFLMPINKIYSLNSLLKCCRLHFSSFKKQKITFEYILIKNVNDSEYHAKKLCSLLSNIKAKINLIPFNEYNECIYEHSIPTKILKFQKYLAKNKYTATIRNSKGKDISGACGQLGNIS